MKNEILEILEDILPSVDFRSSNSLMDDMILDSVAVVQIISELSVEYGIEFTYEDLAPENFNSLEAITELVRKKLDR